MTGCSGTDLVIGKTADHPFCQSTIHKRAKRLWKAAREREDEEASSPEGERSTTQLRARQTWQPRSTSPRCA
jgi:hypothetical protein